MSTPQPDAAERRVIMRTRDWADEITDAAGDIIFSSTAYETVLAVLRKARDDGAAAERPKFLAVLAEHYLMAVICDHETSQDNPVCACSRVFLGWHPSVGDAVQAWIGHVADLLRGAS